MSAGTHYDAIGLRTVCSVTNAVMPQIVFRFKIVAI